MLVNLQKKQNVGDIGLENISTTKILNIQFAKMVSSKEFTKEYKNRIMLTTNNTVFFLQLSLTQLMFFLCNID